MAILTLETLIHNGVPTSLTFSCEKRIGNVCRLVVTEKNNEADTVRFVIRDSPVGTDSPTFDHVVLQGSSLIDRWSGEVYENASVVCFEKVYLSVNAELTTEWHVTAIVEKRQSRGRHGVKSSASLKLSKLRERLSLLEGRQWPS